MGPDPRVLVVAESDDLVGPLCQGLDALGWRTMTARTVAAACAALTDLRPETRNNGQCHVLPVWYDLSVGPELSLLATRAGCSVSDVIRRHSEHEYQVFALGFAPGFAFMGLVEEALAAPRLNTPRKRVASGSVGIAERQTAAYPAQSPGGWNLIGLMKPGDTVRFAPITHAEFIRLGGDDTPQEALA